MAKIDFFIGGHYVCSSTRYRNFKDAVAGFRKNPTWQGMKPDGTLGLCRCALGPCDSVSVFWSDRQ